MEFLIFWKASASNKPTCVSSHPHFVLLITHENTKKSALLDFLFGSLFLPNCMIRYNKYNRMSPRLTQNCVKKDISSQTCLNQTVHSWQKTSAEKVCDRDSRAGSGWTLWWYCFCQLKGIEISLVLKRRKLLLSIVLIVLKMALNLYQTCIMLIRWYIHILIAIFYNYQYESGCLCVPTCELVCLHTCICVCIRQSI